MTKDSDGLWFNLTVLGEVSPGGFSIGVGKLNGWWLPNPKSDRTLLFFHGNYGNISHNLERIQFHHSLGFSVLAIDYRGYGKSLGYGPNEQAAY
ncbi:MAG: hypothetical protein AAF050_20775, partial [Cyanobacteria bacterium J06649_5]